MPWRARALTAAVALNFCGGSLYALSVLLKAFEASTKIAPTITAFGFSLAAAAFLGGVLTAPAVGRVVSIARQAFLVGILAMTSLFVAAQWLEVPVILAACAIAYGGCCGQFYSMALSVVRRSGVRALGLAAGMAVASFAVGSAAWSFLIAVVVMKWGLVITCIAMGAVFGLCGGVAGAMLRGAPGSAAMLVSISVAGRTTHPLVDRGRLWVGFFAISTAGLVVISQAAVLADSTMLLSAASLTALVGLSNGAGRIIGGGIADRASASFVLASLAALAAITVALIASGGGSAVAAGGILVALAYGAGSAAYPAVLMRQCPVASFPRNFARLFTAWGLAAMLVPPLAAHWYQSSGGYTSILLAIAALNLLAALVLVLPNSRVAEAI